MRSGLDNVVHDDETIVAISTPLGRSAIGIVRISGAAALRIVARFFQPLSKSSIVEDRRAHVGAWHDSAGLRVDDVVVTFFQEPRSYTGEDVVEISAHGNPLILRKIVEAALAEGARLAMPGEFTLRAVANGKMDLLQAEAVREFIEAQTETQARVALRQLEGALSKRLRFIKHQLVDVIAFLEAGIDFAEDDVDLPDNTAVCGRIAAIRGELSCLKESFGYGKLLISGLKIAIVGKPNVGKSSVFNRLVCKDRSIVTPTPGTTRDVVSETINVAGAPLCFADTAGMHATTDLVESIGVARAAEALAGADLALVIVDGARALDAEDGRVLQQAASVPHLIAINKSDLPQAVDLRAFSADARPLSISAKSGAGFEQLMERLEQFVSRRHTSDDDDFLLTNVRQYDAVVRAIDALSAGEHALATELPHEFALVDLYGAASVLKELTGEILTEDILERIFSTFCIGK